MQKQLSKFRKTELGEIPEEWKIINIERLTDILDSQRIPIKESDRRKREGKIPYYGATGIIDYIDDFIFNEKLLCLAEDGENLRSNVLPNAFTIEGKTWVNNHAHVLRPLKELINHEYLLYFLNFIKLDAYLSFTAQPKLTQDSMRKIKTIVPSLKEQQKIALIISKVEELIQKTDQIIKQTQRLKKGLMQSLLTKGIGHTKLKQTELGEIPEEWQVRKLGEITDLSAGGTPSRFVKEYWENGTIPWLSSGEIRNNIIYSSNEKITTKGLSESAAKLFPKGTVLIAITGQGLTRGRTALLEIDSSTNQSVIGMICNSNIIHNIFLLFYLQNQYWNLRNISQGSNQAGLNLNLLNSYKILVPAIKEQQKIALIISKVEELIQKKNIYKDKIEHLKKGLMQQLLTGKIRVKV